MHFPAEVLGAGLVDGGGGGAEIGGDVVLEAVFADVMEQVLQARNFDDAGASEGGERVVFEA
jgi:hypothetical protein